MPGIKDLIEFKNEYNRTAEGSEHFINNLFGGYYAHNTANNSGPKAFPLSSPNSFSCERTALQTLTILHLIDSGYTPEEIWDSEKIKEAKFNTAAEIHNHIYKKDFDKEWVVDLIKRGAPKLIKEIDERTKDFDFSNIAGIAQKKNVIAIQLAWAAFDLNQEINKTSLGKDVSPDGKLINTLITSGALLAEVKKAAFSTVDIYDLSLTKDQDIFTDDLATVINAKLNGDEVENKKKAKEKNAPLSEVLGSDINYIKYKAPAQAQFFKVEEDVDLSFAIMKTPPLRQKFAMDYAENKLNAQVVDLGSEDALKVKSDKVKWTDLNSLKHIRQQYKAVVNGLSDKLIGIMVEKQLKAKGEKLNLPEEAVTAFKNKMFNDEKLASAFNRINEKVLDKMISPKGKVDKKLIDTVYKDYIKTTVNKLVEEGRISKDATVKQQKEPTLREQIAAYGKTMYAALKKTDSITSWDSGDYKNLHTAMKTFSEEVLKLPETPEGYKQLQQKLIDITVLKNKYVESHEYLEKKSDRQIDRLNVMKDISKFTAKASASIVEKASREAAPEQNSLQKESVKDMPKQL